MSSGWQFDESIPSDVTAGSQVVREIIERLESLGWNGKDIFACHMACEEAVMNAIKHGNQLDPNKKVHITIEANERQLTLVVTDEGPGFDPDAIPDCRDDENLEKTSGRGVLLIRSLMDEVEFNPKGNRISLLKRRMIEPNG